MMSESIPYYPLKSQQHSVVLEVMISIAIELNVKWTTMTCCCCVAGLVWLQSSYINFQHLCNVTEGNTSTIHINSWWRLATRNALSLIGDRPSLRRFGEFIKRLNLAQFCHRIYRIEKISITSTVHVLWNMCQSLVQWPK